LGAGHLHELVPPSPKVVCVLEMESEG